MHSAPAVAYPVGRSHFQLWLVVGLTACSVAGVALWCAAADAVGWSQVLAGALTAAISVAMFRSWWQTPAGQLIWDTNAWSHSVDAFSAQTEPELILDFQVAMLLRLCDSEKGQHTWVWLERSIRESRWLALRRAIFAPVNSKMRGQSDGLPTSEQMP